LLQTPTVTAIERTVLRRTPGGRHPIAEPPVSTRAPRLGRRRSALAGLERGHRPEPPEKTADDRERTSGSRKSLSKIKGLRRFTGNSARVARVARSLKLRTPRFWWPLAPPRALLSRTAWQRSRPIAIRRGARPDRVTREFGYRAVPTAARTPLSQRLESAMIPHAEWQRLLGERGAESFAVACAYADMRQRGACGHAGFCRRTARAREIWTMASIDDSRGRPARQRACSLHSSPAATLDRRPLRELSSMAGKAELPSAAGRTPICFRATLRIYSCCGEAVTPTRASGSGPVHIAV